MTAYNATSLAAQFQIPLGRDFFTLKASEVCQVIEAAEFVKYRKPRFANGSRGRYFYAALNRAARRTT